MQNCEDESCSNDEVSAEMLGQVASMAGTIQYFAYVQWPIWKGLTGISRVPSTSNIPNTCIICHYGGEIPNGYYEYKEEY